MNAAQHQSAFNHLFFDFIAQATSVRDLSGKILGHAIMAKALDEDGTIGTSCLNQFVVDYGAVRQANITAIRDYVLWVFTPGAIRLDDKGQPVLEERKSSLYWDGKNQRFSPATDMVEVDGVNKRVKRQVDLSSVKVRVAACNWWDFNAAKPESAYKAGLLQALKKDMKAMNDNKYLPTKEELAIMKAMEKMAYELGLIKN